METGPDRLQGGRSRRLLWFVFLYVASLGVFALLVYGLRLIIPH